MLKATKSSKSKGLEQENKAGKLHNYGDLKARSETKSHILRPDLKNTPHIVFLVLWHGIL